MHQEPNRRRLSLLACAASILLPIISMAGAGVVLAQAGAHEAASLQEGVADDSSARPLVGQECADCHKEVVKTFRVDPHGKSAQFLTGWRVSSCESCHGDGTKHIETEEPEDIRNPARMAPGEVNEACLQCHTKDRQRLLWRGSDHDRADMSCLTCHSNHGYKSERNQLTKRTEEQLCLSCHTERQQALRQRSTHIFLTEQGQQKVGCDSCHNPHGAETEALVSAPNVNALCYSCHAEKRGPFLWEHAPVRENCLNCHSPHGSNNLALLTARANLVCQSCHITILGRHSTLAGNALDIWTINRGCLNCHNQVHGSNHPSGKTFTR